MVEEFLDEIYMDKKLKKYIGLKKKMVNYIIASLDILF